MNLFLMGLLMWMGAGLLGAIFFICMAWKSSRDQITLTSVGLFIVLGPVGLALSLKGFLHNLRSRRKV